MRHYLTCPRLLAAILGAPLAAIDDSLTLAEIVGVTPFADGAPYINAFMEFADATDSAGLIAVMADVYVTALKQASFGLVAAVQAAWMKVDPNGTLEMRERWRQRAFVDFGVELPPHKLWLPQSMGPS